MTENSQQAPRPMGTLKATGAGHFAQTCGSMGWQNPKSDASDATDAAAASPSVLMFSEAQKAANERAAPQSEESETSEASASVDPVNFSGGEEEPKAKPETEKGSASEKEGTPAALACTDADKPFTRLYNWLSGATAKNPNVGRALKELRTSKVSEINPGMLARKLGITRSEATEALKELAEKGYVTPPVKGIMWGVDKDKVRSWLTTAREILSPPAEIDKYPPHADIAPTVKFFLSLSEPGSFYEHASYPDEKKSQIHVKTHPRIKDTIHAATVTDKAITIHAVDNADLYQKNLENGLRTALAAHDGGIKVKGMDPREVISMIYALHKKGVVFTDLNGKELSKITVNGVQVALLTSPMSGPDRPKTEAPLQTATPALAA